MDSKFVEGDNGDGLEAGVVPQTTKFYTISYDEITPTELDEYRTYFDEIDTDCSGDLSPEEIAAMFKKFGLQVR